jgi:mannonate dehydratase
MVFRWFDQKNDPVTLNQIRQIPGVTGVAGTLADIPAGEPWPYDEIFAYKRDIEAHGLELEVIESVNVHEDIKLGLPSRDRYIENYIKTIENLGRLGVKVVCYNFMPVFDWLRTELNMPLGDGSYAMAYDDALLSGKTPAQIAADVGASSGGFSLPGWEKERLKTLLTVLEQYENINEDRLFENLGYFLNAVMPACEKYGVKMAIHPDDPPWRIFGLPRIVTCRENLERILALSDSPCNGLTLCSGSLGVNPQNDVPAMIRHFGKMGRVHFGHVRNIRILGSGRFHEVSHLSADGSLDMYEIMKAYHDIGFEGYIRPDHGRMIWGETGRPGYGLFDRALGAMYLQGLREAIGRQRR